MYAVLNYCRLKSIIIETYVERKMKFNKTRPPKHDKKY